MNIGNLSLLQMGREDKSFADKIVNHLTANTDVRFAQGRTRDIHIVAQKTFHGYYKTAIKDLGFVPVLYTEAQIMDVPGSVYDYLIVDSNNTRYPSVELTEGLVRAMKLSTNIVLLFSHPSTELIELLSQLSVASTQPHILPSLV